MTSRASLLTTVAAFVTLALVIVCGSTLEGQEARGKVALLIDLATLKEQAPATFKANFDTTKGSFVVEVHRDWAPIGADRFYSLVRRGYYDENRFFRVTDLLVQWGINGDPEIAKHWIGAKIPDDPPRKQSNKKGTIAFLQANQRRTQVLVNLVDNTSLDSQISPIGQVVSGMDVLGKLYPVEMAPTGKGPMLTPMFQKGNAYLEKEFPMLDYIKIARLVP
jgi:peptidyl-prolyl cis-trans isomerase A (cyclophilin A)